MPFAVTIVVTVAVSFFCSLSEALILNTTATEIEALKKRSLRHGAALERLKLELNDTISAIVALNTIALIVGAALVGGFAARTFGDMWVGAVAAALALTVLLVASVLPKNLGIAYRARLQPHLALPLMLLRRILSPITFLSNLARRFGAQQEDNAPSSEQEIILLAERSAKEGKLTSAESRMITNALTLDDVRVSELMTPRTVVTALEKSMTLADVFREFKNIPFARIPVYENSIDHVVGLVRRRDLLKAKANDLDQELVGNLMQEVHFVPETVSAAAALQMCLKTHHQLLVVVDEFGSVAGVITMEDIIEHIIGKEIFEKDDVAVDMRELARARRSRPLHATRSGRSSRPEASGQV